MYGTVILEGILQASGVKAAKECLEKFEELKTKKQHRYMTFKLTDALNSIIVENMEHKGNVATY